jgi:hypothetical protein
VEQGSAISTAPAAADALRAERREVVGLSLVAVALPLGVLPCWLMSRSFFPVTGSGVWQAGPNGEPVDTGVLAHRLDWATHSLGWYVTHRLAWGLAVGALHVIPLWYWWWRRSRIAWGGLVGAALSFGTAAALWLTIAATHDDLVRKIAQCHIRGYHPALVASAFVLAAAFVVAPPPRDDEALNELQIRSLLRRKP